MSEIKLLEFKLPLDVVGVGAEPVPQVCSSNRFKLEGTHASAGDDGELCSLRNFKFKDSMVYLVTTSLKHHDYTTISKTSP